MWHPSSLALTKCSQPFFLFFFGLGPALTTNDKYTIHTHEPQDEKWVTLMKCHSMPDFEDFPKYQPLMVCRLKTSQCVFLKVARIKRRIFMQQSSSKHKLVLPGPHRPARSHIFQNTASFTAQLESSPPARFTSFHPPHCHS